MCPGGRRVGSGVHCTCKMSKSTIAETIISEQSKGDQPDFRDLPDGGILWKASLVLLNYIEKKALDTVKGKKVLELGSGAGHLAIALHRLGAKITCTERKFNGNYDRLAAAAQAEQGNVVEGASIGACELEWGADSFVKSPLATQPIDFDVIIMSELIYEPDSHELLLETLQKVCKPSTLIYSIFCDRPFSFMFFVKLHDAGGFIVEAIPDDEVDLLGMQPDARVCMHRIRLSSE
jgi:predicted nicotinamide N-methyase